MLGKTATVTVGVLLDENKSRYLQSVFSQPEFRNHLRIVWIDLVVVRESLTYRFFRLLHRALRTNLRQLELETEVSAVLRICKANKVQKLIAVDNKLDLFATLRARTKTPRIECYVLQMSTNPIHRDLARRNLAHEVSVTMFTWGRIEEVLYVRNGLVPSKFITVGSAKHELAKRYYPSLGAMKSWDICLVSMFASQTRLHDNPSESATHERETMPKMLSLLKPIVSKHNLKVVVAVRTGQGVLVHSREDEELDFYRHELGDLAELSDYDKPFASYAAAASSRLVIGRSSAMLTEYLGSESRVLFVNPTTYHVFDAPIDMPFQLSLPTEMELEATILKLLNLSDQEYGDEVRAAREKYCLSTEHCFKTILNELVGPGLQA